MSLLYCNCSDRRKWKMRSAGRASGERPALLKDADSSDRGNSLRATLTRLVNFFAAGRAAAPILPYLCGGNLFSALKKAE